MTLSLNVLSLPRSEPTQCTMLGSRQGTDHAIEEVEDEQDRDSPRGQERAGPAEQGEGRYLDVVGGASASAVDGRSQREEGSCVSEAGQDYLFPAECEVHLYSSDTDAPTTFPTDAEVPPSYSKAVSFDRASGGSDKDDNKRLMDMTPDACRSDYLDDSLLPSLTHELTASELLLNK